MEINREHERLRWHCRRGLLELDILLGRFLDKELAQLSKQDANLFDELLRLQDNDLLDVILGKQALQDPKLLPMLLRVRQV